MSAGAMILIEALVKYGPGVIRQVQEIFATEKPTPEQWDALWTNAQKSYDDYIAEARKSAKP